MKNGKVVLYNDDVIRLDEIKIFIDQNFDQSIDIKTISQKFSISPATLRRHFFAHYQELIGHYVRKRRMLHAMTLLTKHSVPISQLGLTVGYNHRSAFTHAFTKFFGNPPIYFLKMTG